MAIKRLLVAYYSGRGSTQAMAEEISKGAQQVGVKVELKSIEDCRVDDLVKVDGIVIGSPTYFSNVAWQIKRLIDESITLYSKGHLLEGKFGGCFTSAGTKRDGKDCIRMLELAFGFHHRMKMTPGIVRASGDAKEKTSQMCQQYGREIAKLIIN